MLRTNEKPLLDHPVPLEVSLKIHEPDACELRLQTKSVIVVADRVKMERRTGICQRGSMWRIGISALTDHLIELRNKACSKDIDCNSQPQDPDIDQPLLPVFILIVRIPKRDNSQDHG